MPVDAQRALHVEDVLLRCILNRREYALRTGVRTRLRTLLRTDLRRAREMRVDDGPLRSAGVAQPAFGLRALADRPFGDAVLLGDRAQ